jgi:uncharacterized membrane protein YoaK (UPF0700 family)
VTRDPIPPALLSLTFVTGLVDAVAFLGLDRVFTANQTGNVVLLAFAWAGADGLSARASLVSLLAFAAGSALGGLHARRRGSRRRSLMTTALFVEAGLCAAATVAAINFGAGSSDVRRDAIIALLALAMGIRNATVRRLGIPDMTTTVLTMTLTGLTADRPRARGDGGATARRAGSVLAMFVGALVGALLVVRGHLVPALVLVSVTVLVTAAAYAAGSAPRTLEGRA